MWVKYVLQSPHLCPSVIFSVPQPKGQVLLNGCFSANLHGCPSNVSHILSVLYDGLGVDHILFKGFCVPFDDHDISFPPRYFKNEFFMSFNQLLYLCRDWYINIMWVWLTIPHADLCSYVVIIVDGDGQSTLTLVTAHFSMCPPLGWVFIKVVFTLLIIKLSTAVIDNSEVIFLIFSFLTVVINQH